MHRSRTLQFNNVSLYKMLPALIILTFLSLLIIQQSTAMAQDDFIDFESDQWIIGNADIGEHMGRKALNGYAYLKDVEFENGIIEVDVAVTGARSYPGIIFRMQSEQDYERYYMRPHRMNLYPDAHQYCPVINGIAGWQLYNGDGYTSMGDVPSDKWVHLRMEIKGKQARLFVDNSEEPALVVNDLKHGISKGSIGLFGPKDNTAYFSNFRYEMTDDLEFPDPPEIKAMPGLITDWEISQSFRSSTLDLEKPYDEQDTEEIKWKKVQCEADGFVDVARYMGRASAEIDCIWARTTIESDSYKLREFKFGYSDAVTIFLNGEILFTGVSTYQGRDQSFLGIIGLNDAIYLPLKKGENELLFLVMESFGGWGFMCQDGDYVYMDQSLTKKWDMPRKLRMPEAVVYDKKRDVLYVSNYYNNGKEFLSKVGLDGKITEREWITGVIRPTGMCIHDDKLYSVERMGVSEIDLETGEVIIKYPIADGILINDIACDKAGNFYISDSRKNVIFKLSGGTSEVWLEGEHVASPNGLCMDGDRLIYGNSGDGCLKAVGLADKKVSTIVSLGSGAGIDGICHDGKDNFLVSDFNGRVFLVTRAGETTELLNSTVTSGYCADFEYIPEKGMLVIPSAYENNLTLYKYSPAD